MRYVLILMSLSWSLTLSGGCGSSPSVVRDSASPEEELGLQQVQQAVEVEERQRQAQILTNGHGG